MPLTNIAAYRLAGYTIDDIDIDDNAEIEISKLATWPGSLRLCIAGTIFLGNGAGCVKANNNLYAGMVMPDANSSDISHSFALPDEWDSGNITVRIFWIANSVANNLKLTATIKSTVAGGTTASEESVSATDASNGVAFTINDMTMAFAAADFTKGDVVGLNIARVPADAADTLGVDAIIVGVAIEFTGRG